MQPLGCRKAFVGVINTTEGLLLSDPRCAITSPAREGVPFLELTSNAIKVRVDKTRPTGSEVHPSAQVGTGCSTRPTGFEVYPSAQVGTGCSTRPAGFEVHPSAQVGTGCSFRPAGFEVHPSAVLAGPFQGFHVRLGQGKYGATSSESVLEVLPTRIRRGPNQSSKSQASSPLRGVLSAWASKTVDSVHST